MKSKLIIIFIFVIAGLGFFVYKNKSPNLHELKIGEVTIKYEVAKTNEEIAKGLSYRKDLPEGQGMLFVFSEKGLRSFWMQEMMFPLDMIWIADNKVVQIDKNVPIKTNGAWTVVNPNYPIDKVLEMKGGEADRLGLTLGSILDN